MKVKIITNDAHSYEYDVILYDIKENCLFLNLEDKRVEVIPLHFLRTMEVESA
jgi:hypothetical protein